MEKNELLMKFAYLKEQGEILMRNIAMMEDRLKETLIARNTLEELKKIDKGELLVPIGGGCYIEADIKKLNKITINVGAGIAKEVSIDESISKLDENTDNIKKVISNARENLSKIEKELAAIDQELRKQQ